MRRVIALAALLVAGCGGAAITAPPGVRVVRVSPAAREPGAASRARGALQRSRTAYRDLDFDAAIAAANEAITLLLRDGRTSEDFDALHAAYLDRAVAQIGLGRTDYADASLLEAARLRPESGLPEDRYAPDVRARYDALGERVRTATPIPFTVTSVPSGMRVHIDGNDAGRTPVTVDVASGEHLVQLERLGCRTSVDRQATRVTRVDLDVHVAPATLDDLAAQLADGAARAEARELTDHERDLLADIVGSRVLVVIDASHGVAHALTLPVFGTAASWDEHLDTTSDASLHASIDALLRRASRPDFGPPAHPR